MLLKRIAVCFLLASTAAAADLPDLTFPAGVGVNIHFVTGHEQDLDLIAAGGFKWVRMDFAWGATERKAGAYDWSEYDKLTAGLEKRGLHAIYILDYSNPLYEEKVSSVNPLNQQAQSETASPQHPESIAAFARWAAAAAKHFHGKPIVWEIWNEPNITFWKPKPSARQYSELALATCRAIRNMEPRAGIIAPACSTFDWPFLQRFLESGVLEYLDGVSVHPYRGDKQPPETAAADYKRLRDMIRKYAIDEEKQKLPIISGEWGYSSKRGGVSVELQGSYLVRQQLANVLEGVPLSIWYDWKNDWPDLADHESNFGTVTHDLNPKPAYVAVKVMTRELNGCRVLRRLELGEKDYVLVCVDSSGGCKLAAWTTGDSHEVSFDLPLAGAITIVAINGGGSSYTPKREGGKLMMELSAAPKYVIMR